MRPKYRVAFTVGTGATRHVSINPLNARLPSNNRVRKNLFTGCLDFFLSEGDGAAAPANVIKTANANYRNNRSEQFVCRLWRRAAPRSQMVGLGVTFITWDQPHP